ncbi:sulfurtransferase complex subunit TusB [Halomonas sp. Bachu 37]|uniref:sulfurtransferase complex subunit TusB n=1 Tax=Halomonas kashgarensis TaxID=3084920 RepID=UPI003217AB8C
MNLHILNHPPGHGLADRQAISAMGDKDRLLLIEDGVQALLMPQWEGWHKLNGRIYFLEEDACSRGVAGRAAQLQDCHAVDMPGFVALTASADKTITWF